MRNKNNLERFPAKPSRFGVRKERQNKQPEPGFDSVKTGKALEPIQSITPPAAWLGGKRLLAKRLDARISAIPHRTYAEPFLGMGGVFFRRTSKPKVEIVNDLNDEVINLFRILREHYPQFMDCLKYQITSRSEFERLTRQEASSLTDLQRAARFLYLQRQRFGGQVVSKSFAPGPMNPGRFDVSKLGPLLDAIHERLSGVILECLPYDRFITRYDRPTTLFYLDPPYHGCEDDYGKDLFSEADFAALAEQLSEIKGVWIMSINDTPLIRELFGRFEIEEVKTTYSVGSLAHGKGKKVTELIISKPAPV